jgi:hypothetical protein
MLAVLLSSLALVLATPAFAQDPLKSGACEQRLDALNAARAAGAQANAERIEVLRRQATQACLGGSGAATRPSPVLRESIAVAPPTPGARRAPHSPQPAAPPVPPVAIERPPVITSCDTGGCWDSNGTRLNRAGPVLLGPGGMCTTVGTTVRCP